MVENKIKFPSQIKLAEIERKLNSEDESQAPFIAMPTLETSHFTLRPLKAEDYDALYLAAADPKIWEQHPVPDHQFEFI